MFFNQVVLSKDAWHYRLQNWTFGHVPYTNNFCPFFWLTIFCLLVSPFVGGWRATKFVVLSLLGAAGMLLELTFGKLADWIDKYLCQPWYERQVTTDVREMGDEGALHLIESIFNWPFKDDGSWRIDEEDFSNPDAWSNSFYKTARKHRNRRLDQWNRWRAKHEDWKERLEAVRKRREERRAELKALEEARKEANRQAEIRRKKLFALLIKLTKYVAVAVVTAIGCGILYLLAMLTYTIYANWGGIIGWCWSALTSIGSFLVWLAPYVGYVVAGVAALIGLVYLVMTIKDKCNISMPFAKQLGKFADGVVSVVEFFITFAKAFKEDNCPAIEWKDDAV